MRTPLLTRLLVFGFILLFFTTWARWRASSIGLILAPIAFSGLIPDLAESISDRVLRIGVGLFSKLRLSGDTDDWGLRGG